MTHVMSVGLKRASSVEDEDGMVPRVPPVAVETRFRLEVVR